MIEYSKPGYTKPLFILAFDHRGSFMKKMFGISGQPTIAQTEQISQFKQVIFAGFKQAVAASIPKGEAAILIDEQFGDAILREAREEGYIFCMSSEKSGQDEFDFEYGDEFAVHIERYHPTFVKALIRYNPEADQGMNARQRGRLKIPSNYCHEHGYKFLIEPLIPATPEQLQAAGGDAKKYDLEVRPQLMVKMISELQADSVEPDIWKIEGLESTKHYEEVVAQARTGGRDNVSAVILGRGADAAQVEVWLRAAAKAKGLVGFAIGRTIFWEPLVALRDGKSTDEQATAEIAKNYQHFYKVFQEAK
jgi:myo-inositol catabolism protein IolC